MRKREGDYEEELRVLRRQNQEGEFQLYKSREENQLKISLMRQEHESEFTRMQEELERMKAMAALEKG